MALKVLWTHRLSGEAARDLAPPPGVELRIETDHERALALRDWPQVLVDGGPPEELLDGERLERVVVPYAGLGARLRGYLLSRPHLRAHNSHFNDAMVAQHVVALLLAVANRVVWNDAALRRGDWGPPERTTPGRGVFLRGKRALLLGYGSIARAAAPALRALGLELVAFRRRPAPGGEVPQVGRDGLLEALAGADVVLCTLPLTDETRGLIGERELAALKETAILVNVGRGAVIDEEALYRTLAEGRVFGAGLDVWWVYPRGEEERSATPPSRFPFADLPNVVMTPHSANDLMGWRTAAARDVLDTVAALTRGEERNLVDVAAGY
jgi:phosphoglycerate dehydrogenase-like enzyme